MGRFSVVPDLQGIQKAARKRRKLLKHDALEGEQPMKLIGNELFYKPWGWMTLDVGGNL